MEFSAQDLELLKSYIQKDTTTQGFAPGMGLEAIHLDEFVKLAYAIFYPELRKIPHISPEMAGQRWGGTSYQWRSLVNPNAAFLPAAVSAGNRNAISSVTAVPYSAPYCTLGYDQEVIWEEYEFMRGLDDAMALARNTTVHNILKNYDVLATAGNRGPDSNGFALGTTNTPAVVSTATTGGSIPASTSVYVRAVALTAMGYYVNKGASTSITSLASRTPANGSTPETVPVGVAEISASSAANATGSGTSTNTVTFSVTPKNGEVGYAWYAGTSNIASAQKFVGVTNVPSITITALPAGGNQAANATNLQTDYSYNGFDGGVSNTGAAEFDGAFAYLVNSLSSARPAQYINLMGVGITATGTGTVQEIDNAIAAQFDAYQAVPDELVCGISMIDALTAAVQSGASNLRFTVEAGSDGSIRGGQVIKEYRLKFSADGNQKIIPVSVSPNIPDNAIWLPSRQNPFPSTSSTIPAVLQLAEIKPMYSMNYALTARKWELGTYVHTTLVNRAPFLGIMLVGGAPEVIT